MLLLVYVILYTALLLLLFFFWKKNTGRHYGGKVDPKVALVIPFRNEMDNLPLMVDQVASYVPQKWQVIWVDDQSDDGSKDFLRGCIQKIPACDWELLDSRGMGKKSALDTGIRNVDADIIITTDADVRFHRNPFLPLIEAFSDPRIQLVAGPVLSSEAKGWFAAFQQIEWASIQLVTGSSFAMKIPLMCSGANLAFRRSAFLEVDGYKGNEHYLSGDDEFLMKKIVHQFGVRCVSFLSTPGALVEVFPFEGLGGFIQQRVRWAGKWRSHRSLPHVFGAAIGFMIPVFALISIVLWQEGRCGFLAFMFFWFIKICAEYYVLGRILLFYGKKQRLVSHILTSVVHPWYVFRVGLGTLYGKFTWKGRKSK